MLDDRRRDKSLSAYAASSGCSTVHGGAAQQWCRRSGLSSGIGRGHPCSEAFPGARARGAAATRLQDAGRGRGDGAAACVDDAPGVPARTIETGPGRLRPVRRHWRTRRRAGALGLDVEYGSSPGVVGERPRALGELADDECRRTARAAGRRRARRRWRASAAPCGVSPRARRVSP